MQEGNGCVVFHRKKSIRHGDIDLTRHADEFQNEPLLLLSPPYMLQNSIRRGDLETLIGERQCGAWRNTFISHQGKRSPKSLTFAQARGCNAVGRRIELLKNIRTIGNDIRNANVND